MEIEKREERIFSVFREKEGKRCRRDEAEAVARWRLSCNAYERNRSAGNRSINMQNIKSKISNNISSADSSCSSGCNINISSSVGISRSYISIGSMGKVERAEIPNGGLISLSRSSEDRNLSLEGLIGFQSDR